MRFLTWVLGTKSRFSQEHQVLLTAAPSPHLLNILSFPFSYSPSICNFIFKIVLSWQRLFYLGRWCMSLTWSVLDQQSVNYKAAWLTETKNSYCPPLPSSIPQFWFKHSVQCSESVATLSAPLLFLFYFPLMLLFLFCINQFLWFHLSPSLDY